MAFVRTRSGLSNLHLFYRSRQVLFVEGGGENITIDDIIRNKSNHHAIDVIFWRTLLKAFGYKDEIVIKPIGSKGNVLAIAEQVIASDSATLVVAMDRDYDFINKKNLSHPRILYTYGYCWENDVWQKPQILGFLKHFVYTQGVPKDVEKKIVEAYRQFEIDLKRFSKLQYYYATYNMRFMTKELLAGIVNSRDTYPKIERKVVLRHSKQANSQRDKSRPLPKMPILRNNLDVSGKILKKFGYALLKALYNKEHRDNVGSLKIIEGYLIAYCGQLGNMGFNRFQERYYERAISNLAGSV